MRKQNSDGFLEIPENGGIGFAKKMEFSMTRSAKILLHEMTVHWLNQRLR